jgi:GcrA cell cycle regulator
MADTPVWTEERLNKLRKLWEKGLSISQIGEELNVSRNAIAGKVYRLGLPKRQSPISNKSVSKSPVKVAPVAELQDTEMDNMPLKLALRKISWSRSKCSWPIGDPKSTAFKFCGEEVVVGKPYCNDHCFEAYTTNRDSGGS